MNFTDLKADLGCYSGERIVFAGLGNRQRGDDAAGLEFLELLRNRGYYPDACFISAGTNPENYLEKIRSGDYGLVVFIDACDFGGRPGEVSWLESREVESSGISTHAYSMVILEKYLNFERETECRYLGIQPLILSEGEGLSADVIQGLRLFFE